MCDVNYLWSRFWYESQFVCIQGNKVLSQEWTFSTAALFIYLCVQCYHRRLCVCVKHPLWRAPWQRKQRGLFGTTCNVPMLALGVAGLCRFPIEVMRHIGSLLHLAKRRACMSQTGYWGDICKYLQSPASRNTTLWRPSKPLTMRFVWIPCKIRKTHWEQRVLSNSHLR